MYLYLKRTFISSQKSKALESRFHSLFIFDKLALDSLGSARERNNVVYRNFTTYRYKC